MNRRDFLKGALVTAAGLVIPYEPKVFYSIPAPLVAGPGDIPLTELSKSITDVSLGELLKQLYAPWEIEQLVNITHPLLTR